MVDVSEIKTVTELLEIRDDLNFFINEKVVAEIYKEQKMDADDLEGDRQMAQELLGNVLRRLTQLSQGVKKPDSSRHRRDA